MSRRLLAGVATAALTFGLVACGDGGDGPVTTPPPDIGIDAPSDGGGDDPSDGGGSASSDGGGDSDAAAPDIPAPDPADYPGMDQNTPEGAEQAFRYYIAVMIWGYQTGEHNDLAALQGDACDTCTANLNAIQSLDKKGKYWSKTAIEDVGMSHYSSDEYDFEVGYNFYLSAHTEPDPESGQIAEEARTQYIAAAVMAWEEDSWKVISIRLTPQE